MFVKIIIFTRIKKLLVKIIIFTRIKKLLVKMSMAVLGHHTTATFVCLFQSLFPHSSKIIQHHSITLNHPLGFCSVSLRMLTDNIQGMV